MNHLGRWHWIFMIRLCVISMILASAAAAQQPVSISDEPHHHFVLENQFFRVYALELAPQAATKGYACKHDCVLVPLRDSELLDNANSLQLRKGDAWPLATHVIHFLVNHGDAVLGL